MGAPIDQTNGNFSRSVALAISARDLNADACRRLAARAGVPSAEVSQHLEVCGGTNAKMRRNVKERSCLRMGGKTGR